MLNNGDNEMSLTFAVISESDCGPHEILSEFHASVRDLGERAIFPMNKPNTKKVSNKILKGYFNKI